MHRFAPPLKIPPLRERREEILPLAHRCILQRARRAGVAPQQLSPTAESLLLGYEWPGNVRQLESVLGHAVLLASGPVIDETLLRSLFPAEAALDLSSAAGTWQAFQEKSAERERAWLGAAVAAQGGNLSAAARSIDCPLSTLRSLLRRHGLL